MNPSDHERTDLEGLLERLHPPEGMVKRIVERSPIGIDDLGVPGNRNDRFGIPAGKNFAGHRSCLPKDELQEYFAAKAVFSGNPQRGEVIPPDNDVQIISAWVFVLGENSQSSQ